jgi:hypothetical protein
MRSTAPFYLSVRNAGCDLDISCVCHMFASVIPLSATDAQSVLLIRFDLRPFPGVLQNNKARLQ